ncbi:MAG: OB-fold nucleic acid binding domain-containing protein [Aeromicrobium erythreum]
MSGLLGRARARRLSVEDEEDGELQHEAAEAGCSLIAAQHERRKCSVHGVVRSVTVRPAGDTQALEVELYDGSGSVTLVWLGRCSIQGVSPGRKLTAEGRFGIRGTDERVVYNPRYELDA